MIGLFGLHGDIYHVYQLGELEAQLDCEGLGEVGDRSDEAVVVVEKVIIQPLGMGVADTNYGEYNQINMDGK